MLFDAALGIAIGVAVLLVVQGVKRLTSKKRPA
jgi:hypothetical protein